MSRPHRVGRIHRNTETETPPRFSADHQERIQTPMRTIPMPGMPIRKKRQPTIRVLRICPAFRKEILPPDLMSANALR